MTEPHKTQRRLILGLIAGGLIGIVAWIVVDWSAAWVMQRPADARPANAIVMIAPYQDQGTWVFDDPAAGLEREPFVAGIPEMIDVLVKDIPDAANGFRLYFSASPFPGHQKTLTWVRKESDGNYYRCDDPPMEGWLCPALYRYFDEAPATIYVKAEPKEK